MSIKETLHNRTVAALKNLRFLELEHGISLEQARSIYEDCPNLIDDTEAFELFHMANAGAVRIVNAGDLHNSLLKTGRLELMYCPKAYVVSESPRLISPSGFHPSERVVVQPDIAIHCDEIPSKLPTTNKTLYAHRVG